MSANLHTTYVISGGFASGGETSASREIYSAALGTKTVLGKRRHATTRETPPISFDRTDLARISTPHDDALVVTATIVKTNVERILIDGGSSSDIMFLQCYDALGLERKRLRPVNTPLVGFAGRTTYAMGTIRLPMTLGKGWDILMMDVDFIIVDAPATYNAILGRTTLNHHQIVASTAHQVMKFPSLSGEIGVVRGNQLMARRCYVETLRRANQRETLLLEADPDPRDEERRPEPMGEFEDVEIDGPGKTVKIGADLPDSLRENLIALLRRFKELFAWKPSDMPGISTDVISHQLKVDPLRKPVVQKQRPMGSNKQLAIRQEVGRLLDAGFVAPTHYQSWVANPVLVPKPNNKWRMCVDYRDLNKACPKDSYPLPRIDQLVDATAGHQMLSFMDAYSGYNQIKMNPYDAEATAFYADGDIYHYTVMPFGLLNAGATYQRMVNKVFGHMLGRSMEAYVDDMLVKSKESRHHIDDLTEAFECMRIYKVRLNPSKCTFGVGAGKFLGFMVSQRGIEANPEKIEAIERMTSPRNHKDVQRLNGRLAALERFLAKSGEKHLPFFKVLRANKKFEWTPECEAAFQELKAHLTTLPALSTPLPDEALYLYLGVSPVAVSSVLVRDDGKNQNPVYFVSKVLNSAEMNYIKIEKFLYALVHAARKLRPYFHAHEITVLTDQPLKPLVQRPESSGRMVKWAIELSEFRIHFAPRTAIKGQALADFIVENSLPETEGQPTEAVTDDKDQEWRLYTDGSSAKDNYGAGFILYPPNGEPMRYAMKLTFQATNNEAEYEALLTGLRIAKGLGISRLKAFSDSELVVNQVNEQFQTNDEKLRRYLTEVHDIITSFSDFTLSQIPREENQEADALSKYGWDTQTSKPKAHFVETIFHPTLQSGTLVAVTDATPNWMTPFYDFLKSGTLPANRTEADRIRRQAVNYLIINNTLYKRGFSTPYLKCVAAPETTEILQSLHTGPAASHEGGRTLVQKTLRQGFYWPTMSKEAHDLVKTCDACQRYAPNLTKPPADLTPMMSAWPFAQWGIDLVGPLPKARGQLQWIVVAIDYFSKWIEAKPLASTSTSQIIKFVREQIICRYGIPSVIISDNGTQFASQEFRNYMENHGINHRFASVRHAQSNGQVEAANKIVLAGLKRRLGKRGGDWIDHLDNVLWALRTTPKKTTGETPFGLVYGSEAVAPNEIASISYRVSTFNPQQNDVERRTELDLADERRWASEELQGLMKIVTARYFNRRVRHRQFYVGEWVLRRNEFGTSDSRGKMAPGWEGPYQIIEVPYPNAYKLKAADGRALDRTFNGEHLKKFYM